MKISLSVLFILSGLLSYSQDTTSSVSTKIRYTNSFSSGAMFNDEGNISGSLSVINGIKWKQLRAGIGIGLDGYEDWRFTPLFASITLDLSKKNESAIFLQFNCGHSFGQYVAINNNQGFDGYDDYGGLMINPMMGYRIVVGKNSFIVSAGYKFQKAGIEYKSDNAWYPYASETTTRLNRFFIQLGFGLR